MERKFLVIRLQVRLLRCDSKMQAIELGAQEKFGISTNPKHIHILSTLHNAVLLSRLLPYSQNPHPHLFTLPRRALPAHVRLLPQPLRLVEVVPPVLAVAAEVVLGEVGVARSVRRVVRAVALPEGAVLPAPLVRALLAHDHAAGAAAVLLELWERGGGGKAEEDEDEEGCGAHFVGGGSFGEVSWEATGEMADDVRNGVVVREKMCVDGMLLML